MANYSHRCHQNILHVFPVLVIGALIVFPRMAVGADDYGNNTFAPDQFELFWKNYQTPNGNGSELMQLALNTATSTPSYSKPVTYYQAPDESRPSRASTRTAFLMTNRCLKNDNYTYTGTNSPIWVGGYTRQNPYVYEDLVYADMSSLNGRTIDSVFFKYNVGTNSTGVSTVGFLYEQDKGTYSASAVFNSYALSAWASNVADDTILQTVTGWTQMSSRAAFKTLIQAWTDQSKTNNGLIFAGNPAYYGYYWVISACSLVVWNSGVSNNTPTNITLSASSVNENQAIGTTIGSLTTTDADVGQTHTYSFAGGTDDAKFQISGSNLLTNYVFNYEMKSSYSITLRTTDNGSPPLYYDKAFTITISGINDAPVAGAGKCLDFDGADDIVNVAATSAYNNLAAFTAEAWVYIRTGGENVKGRIFDKANTSTPTNGWLLRTGSDSAIGFSVDYSGTYDLITPTIHGAVSFNAWHHIAVTWDGSVTASNVHIYIDGVEPSYGSLVNGSTSRVDDASYVLKIGNDAALDRTFDGYIDEARLWNAVRTQTQIQDNMRVPLSGSETNLIGYWKMDVSSGTAVRDFTSGASTGECVNMTDGDWIASTAWQSRSLNDIDVLIHYDGYDEDGNALTISQVTAPTHGKLKFTNNTAHRLVFYTPDMNYGSTDTYTYRVSDGSATSDYTINPVITNASNAPIAGSGTAMKFDSVSSEHVDLPSGCLIAAGTGFSLEFWIKPNSPNNFQRIFIQGATDCATRILMAYWYSGHIEFLRATSGTSGTANKASGAISSGVWTHVAWTYDGATTDNVYINGVSSTGTVGGGTVACGGYNLIGKKGDATTCFFNGQLDDIRLWSDERTSSEIADNRYTALTGSEGNLVGYWRMDRSSGDQLRDWSTSGYSGRLHGMTDADWVDADPWKDRTTAASSALTHSAGYDPDADAVTLTTSVAPSSGTLSYNNTNRTVTYTPVNPSSGTYTYTYQIADAKKRATDTYAMSVTVTADVTNPTVSTFSPADNLGGVGLTDNLIITFSEVVSAQTGNIILYKTTGDVLVQTFNVTTDISGTGTTTITINPTASLETNTSYYVTIDATAFDDGSGNSFAGFSDKTTWNFSTSANAHAPIAGSGNCLGFDSSGTEYVSLGTGGMITGAVWTLEFWIKTNSPLDNQRIFLQGSGGYASRQLSALWDAGVGMIEFIASTTSPSVPTAATTAIPNATWTHVAWSYTSGTSAVYVNGQSSAGTNSGTSYGVDGNNFIACRYSTTYRNLFNGSLDEIRLWNDVRTQAEIQANMYAPLTGAESNLVCYWRMDTTAGTTLKNYASGGGYNGTLTNMQDADWEGSDAWKTRTTATPLTHSAGWEPDGDSMTITTVTPPSSGTLVYDNSNETVTFVPVATGTFTYTYQLSDGLSADSFDMSVTVNSGADIYAQWSFSKELTINTTSSGANVSGNVTNFPLLVRLTSGNFTYSEALSTGYDIRFSDANGLHLPYYRERYDNSGQLAEFWVRIPTVYGNNSSQYIKMYWGKSGAGDSASATNVFKTADGYAAVWPLNSGFTDVTSNAFAKAAGNDPDAATGNITGAYDFKSANTDYIQYNYSATLNPSNFTVSAWAKPGTISAYAAVISSRYSPTTLKGYILYAQNVSPRWEGWMGNNSGSWVNTNAPSAYTPGDWYHVVAKFDGTNIKLYQNGLPVDTTAGSHTVNGTYCTRIGAGQNESTPAFYFNGTIDQVELSSIPRSDDWIKLCYETQKSGSTVVIPEATISLLPLTVQNNIGTGISDTCAITTTSWKIIFDEDDGGGIKWLSQESSRGGSRGTNQLNTNLFYVVADNTVGYANPGQLSLLSSSSLLCKFRQDITISNQPWEIDYTVYGSGRIFVRASTEAAWATYDPENGIEFRVESNCTKKSYYKENATASSSNYILHSDTSANRFDILLAPYEDWSQASGFCATTGNYYGYADDDWQLTAGKKQAWEFMIDFAHMKWNDTTGVGAHVDDYRGQDSLEFLLGHVGLERDWQAGLVGHWKFDEGSGATAYDSADNANVHNGTITSATYVTTAADVQWGAACLDFETDGGNDHVTVSTNAADCNAQLFTIMMWLRPETAISANSVLFSKYTGSTGYKLAGDASGYLALTVNGVTFSANTALGTAAWKHVAATYNQHTTAVKIYINGKFDKYYFQQVGVSNTAANVLIGDGYDGRMDDVRMYNKDLSEETIRAIALEGFRPNDGTYILQADNNSTTHFKIDGTSAVPHRFPIFQIFNYWATTTPKAVYYNGSWMTSTTDYLASLDDASNVLAIGFNKSVSASATRIYIDDNDSSGALMTGPMKTMTYGTSGSDYYVQNTSNSSFGASGSNEFYFFWKMTNGTSPTTTSKDGEIFEFKSSETDPGEVISSGASNILAAYDTSGSFGYHDHYGGTYGTSSAEINAAPTYTVVEASPTRVQFKLDKRRINDVGASNVDYDLTTIWTIYPTGQIFRYDSIPYTAVTITYPMFRVRTKYEAGCTNSLSTTDKSFVIYGTTTTHDYVAASLETRDVNDLRDFYTGYNTVQYQTNTATYMGCRFDGMLNLLTSEVPFIFATYLDIRDQNMSAAYRDSVVKAVKYINFTTGDMIIGTRTAGSEGDIDEDGFNEGEGAYVMYASSNSVNFRLRADTCRFYPAFRITNYTANNKPRYLRLYKPTPLGNGRDTVMLLEGYGYNAYVNTTSDYLVVQLDTVLCADTKIYISGDDDLAVTMSDFYAMPGDGNDTLHWRTDSEKDNQGFFIYRRIKPSFLDSLSHNVDSATVDSILDNAGRMFQKGSIGYADTLWVSITPEIIPSAVGGNSPEPHDYSKIDWDVENDIEYEYMLYAVDINKTRDSYGPVSVRPMIILPKRFFLFHNFPNPVRYYTNIRFDLPKETRVSLYVYNLQGRLIARLIRPDMKYKAGFYKVRWDCTDDFGRPIAAGPYIYRLNTTKYVKNRLLIVVK